MRFFAKEKLMKLKLIIVISILSLFGCESTRTLKVEKPDPVMKKIERLAASIAEHSSTLSALEQSRYQRLEGPLSTKVDFDIVPTLGKVISLGADFNGPMEPFLTLLSKNAGMNPPRILNLKPSADVIVSVNTEYRRLIDILRDVGSQSGTRANITYKAAENLLEIEYATF